MSTRGPAHGEFSLSWHGEVLVARYDGVFNEEGVLSHAGAILTRINDCPRWGLLSDARAWSGFTPEAMLASRTLVDACFARGLVAIAILVPCHTFEKMSRQVVDRGASAGPAYSFAPDPATAIEWLATHGLQYQGDPP